MDNNIFKNMPIQDILKFAKIGYACYPLITSFEKPKEATKDDKANTTNTIHHIIPSQRK